MKHLHKFASVLLALVMAFSLMAPAFASGNNGEQTTAEITISNPVAGHTYTVYQIFVGDLHDKTLSNVKWGQNGTGTEGESVDQTTLDALVAATGTDNAKLDIIEQYLSTTGTPIDTLSTEKKSTGKIATGYYLIKDNGPAGEGDSISLNVVQLVGDVDVTLKTSSTSLEKKVQDINDSTGTESGWQDSADYDIGDDVPFQLTATLGDGIEDYYETYMVEFNDTLSKGLTFNKDSVKVTIDGEDKTSSFTVSDAVAGENDSTSFTVKCDDVKAIDAKNNSKIVLTYTAKLNDKAVIGSAGNTNEAFLKYTNNPNNTGDGEPKPGETPKDKVVVFTFKGIVDKVHKNPNYNADLPEGEGSEQYLPLTGAGFTLYKKDKDGNWQNIGNELVGGDTTKFEWTGLDDGEYKLEETTTPAGYNTIAPIEFTIEATHDEKADDPQLTELKAIVTSGTAEINGNATSGELSTQIENQSGAVLPETGGIGTTIFYVVGGLLTVGAVVLLVTKKRMSADSDK